MALCSEVCNLLEICASMCGIKDYWIMVSKTGGSAVGYLRWDHSRELNEEENPLGVSIYISEFDYREHQDFTEWKYRKEQDLKDMMKQVKEKYGSHC